MPPETTGEKERDLVLSHIQYASVQETANGRVLCYVGPVKQSLSNTEAAVVYNSQVRRFEKANLGLAIKEFPYAQEGWYIVLENPAKNDVEAHPKTGVNNTPELEYGRKMNIPGPVTFPLWPGQVAQVVEGHHLRSNEYLVVRVYNEEAAKEKWTESVMRPRTTGESSEEQDVQTGSEADSGILKPDSEVPVLTMGKLLIVNGTEVSFYIPPTGIEVVKDDRGNYVRDAVTLERLEYCILLDENGDKRFVRGPAVVFPKPTENFVAADGLRKFRPIELNDDMGIYVKVIADYTDEGETGDGKTEHNVGEELFITGKEQKIYFPRPEHAIVKYGDRQIHYGVAIPDGEARYVLDKSTGRIELRKGPCIFLPDPRKEVVVRRVLDSRTVDLWFPGNEEAREYNSRLKQLAENRTTDYVSEETVRRASGRAEGHLRSTARLATDVENLRPAAVAEDFQRGTRYTPPRTITIDSKYEGVPPINVWTGYAIQVVSKTQGRKVVVGPASVLLEYDETLEVLELSTGTPKSDENPKRTVYLRVKNNKVSDKVDAETKDLVTVKITVSYRVNFEGDSSNWFSVENYIKFLTDHLRSMIRHAVKWHGIEDLNNNCTNIIRDVVLGAQQDGKRTGRNFEENGMRVYDVEVLNLEIGDKSIADLLVGAQHDTVKKALDVAKNKQDLEAGLQVERFTRRGLKAKAETARLQSRLEEQEVSDTLSVTLAAVNAELEEAQNRLEVTKANNASELERLELIKKQKEQEIKLAKDELANYAEQLRAEADNIAAKLKAVSPDLAASLQAFSDRELMTKAVAVLGPVALLGGESVREVMARLLDGTVFANAFKGLASRNGASSDASVAKES